MTDTIPKSLQRKRETNSRISKLEANESLDASANYQLQNKGMSSRAIYNTLTRMDKLKQNISDLKRKIFLSNSEEKYISLINTNYYLDKKIEEAKRENILLSSFREQEAKIQIPKSLGEDIKRLKGKYKELSSENESHEKIIRKRNQQIHNLREKIIILKSPKTCTPDLGISFQIENLEAEVRSLKQLKHADRIQHKSKLKEILGKLNHKKNILSDSKNQLNQLNLGCRESVVKIRNNIILKRQRRVLQAKRNISYRTFNPST